MVKNSHLVNELLLELSEQVPLKQGAGSSFLDLGTSDVLEGQLKHLMDTVDELNQVGKKRVHTILLLDLVLGCC